MKDSEKSGCYICKHADWDADGCTCKLTKAIVRAPLLGCPMHEFTLHSATKYKDGTPIMSEPKDVSNQLDTEYCLNGCDAYNKYCDHTLDDKHKCPYLPHTTEANIRYLEQVFTEFARTQDDLIEEYDETLKTHGDTLEQHMERIEDMDTVLATHAGKINNHTDALLEHEHKLSTLSEDVSINEGNIGCISADVEDLQRKVYQIYQFLNSVDPDFFAKIEDQIRLGRVNNGSNFCGNCTHVNKCRAEDGIYACELSGEIVDPDDSSCAMFEPPF